MAAVLTRKRCILFSTFLLSVICFLSLLASVPIKWTPVVAIYPKYTTWHQISSVHLMKILWRAVPPGVEPVKNCTTLIHPAVSQTDVRRYDMTVYGYTSAEAKMSLLQEKEGYPDLSPFLPLLDRTTKVKLLHTYAVLVEALGKVGVRHVVLHGSLLGMYRFSAISPWDDDMDVAINVSRWKDVRDALSCIHGFELHVDPMMRWSFFPSNGAPSNSMKYKKYPFIDIFFQAEDETHIWGMHKVNRRRSVFRKDLMFPMKWGYLDGIRIPIPYKVKEILESQYGNLDLCASQENGHLLPAVSVHSIPCSLLYPVYGNFSKHS